MRTLPEGNAVKTVGNFRHLERTMMSTANGDSLVKKRPRHIEAMKHPKLTGGPRPVGHIGRTGAGFRLPFSGSQHSWLLLLVA